MPVYIVDGSCCCDPPPEDCCVTGQSDPIPVKIYPRLGGMLEVDAYRYSTSSTWQIAAVLIEDPTDAAYEYRVSGTLVCSQSLYGGWRVNLSITRRLIADPEGLYTTSHASGDVDVFHQVCSPCCVLGVLQRGPTYAAGSDWYGVAVGTCAEEPACTDDLCVTLPPGTPGYGGWCGLAFDKQYAATYRGSGLWMTAASNGGAWAFVWRLPDGSAVVLASSLSGLTASALNRHYYSGEFDCGGFAATLYDDQVTSSGCAAPDVASVTPGPCESGSDTGSEPENCDISRTYCFAVCDDLGESCANWEGVYELTHAVDCLWYGDSPGGTVAILEPAGDGTATMRIGGFPASFADYSCASWDDATGGVFDKGAIVGSCATNMPETLTVKPGGTCDDDCSGSDSGSESGSGGEPGSTDEGT